MKKMKELIEKAAGQGVELIVFPELALTGYNCGDHFFEVAETIPGQSTDYFKEIARTHNIYIIWGLPEKGNIPGLLYNSAAIVGPEGYLGRWRKNTLPGHATDKGGAGAFPDRRFFKKGGDLAVIDTKLGKIGLLICYDIFFPELARYLTLKGADLIIGISGSPSFERDIFEPIVKARAMENVIPVVYTNLVGKEGDTEYWGGGCMIGAGDVNSKVPGSPEICKASYTEEGITIGEVDLTHSQRVRPFFPVLRDIETDMYHKLAKVHQNLT
ncbi:putative amidohydrolase [Thalassobacillus devorans]|nr:putative amidohydrolase [Thalassobacillus devorans]